MLDPFIEGERIYLRAITKNDCLFYYHWLNDQETTKYMQQGIYPTSEEDCIKYNENLTNGLNFAIISYEIGNWNNFTQRFEFDLRDTHIGNIALLNIHPTFRTADIAIIIGDKQCWGKGYGAEAIKLLVGHAFNRMNLNRIQVGAVVDNVGSIKAFEKAGFIKEGTARQLYYCDGEYKDVVTMSILKQDWSDSK